MATLQERFEGARDTLNPYMIKLQKSIFVQTVMAGMMSAMPAIMAGSVATMLMSIQIDAYQSFLQSTGIAEFLNLITRVTISMFAVYVVFGMAYNYAKFKNSDAAMAGVIAIASFLVLTPFDVTVLENGRTNVTLPLTWLGAQGIFSAMIVGFIVGIMYTFIKGRGWTIKLPSSVPPVISSSFAGIVPGLIIIGFFGVISVIFEATSYGSLNGFIYTVLQTPLQSLGSNIWAVLFIIFVSQLLWILGVHGPMVVIPIVAIAWRPNDLANLQAFNEGADVLPYITGLAFYMVYSCAGFALSLAILQFKAKSERYRALGKLAVVPAFFGITEPIVFGTPIVMNFRLLIPYVFYPMATTLTAYYLTVAGILPRVTGVGMPTGTPVGFQGLIQGSWEIALFQIAAVIVGLFVYAPFFRALDKEAYDLEQEEIAATN